MQHWQGHRDLPGATIHFSNYAWEQGWDYEEYDLQMEYLFTTTLNTKDENERVYWQALQDLMDNPLEYVATWAQQRQLLSVEE